MWVFYVPIFLYICGQVIRYRGLTFLSVNPGLPMSGLIGESKSLALQQLLGRDELARFQILSISDSVTDREQHAAAFMRSAGLGFPVILKPDFGQRGLDVAVIRTEDALRSYLKQASGDVLIQEHIGGEEFGVFYLRHPDQNQGKLFSITEKTFPVLEGDGVKSLEQLLMENPRTHYMAGYLLELHREQLERILGLGEKFKVVEIGSHCRGSVFLDGNQYITDKLRLKMQSISDDIEGFFFGRFDLRVPDKNSLREAKGIKILEVNGLTSESTNIYDPQNSVVTAYRILFQQWQQAFQIGQKNIHSGAPRVKLFHLLSHLRSVYFTKEH